jgi:hypothetical protein
MPRYIPIKGNDLILVEQEIKTQKIVTKKGPTNHLWIYDRSGSMTEVLPELSSQLISLSKNLPKGDALSLGWFSSEGGQFNWVFKGFRIVDNADYKMLEQAIKNNSSSIGCTCFSEILTDTEVVIQDLSVISKTFAFSFFTDGYPVVSNYTKETNAIFSAIKKIKGKIHTAVFCGFGAYYNKELLSQMSSNLGAMLIHSSEIKEYTPNITKLIKMTDNSEPKEEVECLVSKPMAIFTINDQGVVLLDAEDDGKIYIAPKKGKSTCIYYLSTEKPSKKSWDKIETTAINFGDNNDPLAKAIYGAALVLSQQTKTDIAMDVIGKAGDKAIIDGLNNAFLVEEFGNVESIIDGAINDVSLRFTKGRDPNYLPPADAFCVVNVLDMLLEDDKAAFFPYDPRFKYERISVATKSKDGFSKFTADPKSKCPFNTMVWHESHLNLSLQTSVMGTVELLDKDGKTPKQMGFTNPYPTFVFRNFSFIKDGHVNIKTFYMTSSEKIYKEFKNKGIILEDTFKNDEIYAVDLSKLPAINRIMAEGKTSATDLCKRALAEQKLKAQIKGLKWLKDQELGEEVEEKPVQFTVEQAKFLEANGIQVSRGGLFSPPTEKEDPKDFYMAKFFDVKLAGISSLPPVKKIAEKIASNKPRTLVESLIESGIIQWNKAKGSIKVSDKKKVASWFTTTIKAKQDELKVIRQEIQASKFSVILGKRWFEEWTTRENCELTVDGIKCSLVLGEEKVPV